MVRDAPHLKQKRNCENPTQNTPITLQAANLRGFRASMNPTFEGRIPDFVDNFNTF